MNGNETNVTRYLLQFCYQCEDAAACTTEENCKACMAERGMRETEHDGKAEIKELLRAYYE